jgi:hypothetical protein
MAAGLTAMIGLDDVVVVVTTDDGAGRLALAAPEVIFRKRPGPRHQLPDDVRSLPQSAHVD